MSENETLSIPPSLRRCVETLGLPSTDLNWELLDQALVHASASSERNNEQLEFFGDAVLRLAAAEFLMEQYPQATVGNLTRVRSQIVSDQMLTDIAENIGIEQFLQTSSAAAGDRTARPRRLADAIEAILAVLYLSRGNLALVRPWLDPHLAERAHQLMENPALRNPKTALQELTQKHYKALPDYRTEEISTHHGDPERFRADVRLGDRWLGSGVGASRKEAEKAAASQGYRALAASHPDEAS